MTAPALYDLHGLLIRSEVRLPEPEVAGSDLQHDVLVRVGLPHRVDGAPIDGVRLASLESGGVPYYSAARLDDGRHVLRVHGLCDFVVDEAATVVSCHRDPAADPAYLPILVSGTVLAFVIGLRGALALHASAVEVDGRVLAFAGPSGAGKSTTAAVLCLDGARLVTDDLLRIGASGNSHFVCARGASELRLRPAALAIVGRLPGSFAKRDVADGRTAVRPEPVEHRWSDLAAVVVPFPSRRSPALELERLRSVDAVFSLARFPRIAGWRCPRVQLANFAALTALCSSVPVFHAAIPWGMPGESLKHRLEDAIAGAVATGVA